MYPWLQNKSAFPIIAADDNRYVFATIVLNEIRSIIVLKYSGRQVELTLAHVDVQLSVVYPRNQL